jgi:CheY-like chemotaxis protein
MRILVAEDDAVSRRVLERMGHDCDVTEDGDQAWAQLAQLAMRLAVAERLHALRARVLELEAR